MIDERDRKWAEAANVLLDLMESDGRERGSFRVALKGPDGDQLIGVLVVASGAEAAVELESLLAGWGRDCREVPE